MYDIHNAFSKWNVITRIFNTINLKMNQKITEVTLIDANAVVYGNSFKCSSFN